MIFLLRPGMHDKPSESGTMPRLQRLFSPNKHSHRQHSSVTVLRHTAATRERQGQSLAQAWRDTPHVWNFGHQCPKPLSLFTSMSCLETQHSTVDVWEVLTPRHWTAAAAARSTGRAVMKCCLGFFCCCCETCGWKVLHACSCAIQEAGSSRVTTVVCLFYPECYNKDILTWNFASLSFGEKKIQIADCIICSAHSTHST